jgi:hypothetical protein
MQIIERTPLDQRLGTECDEKTLKPQQHVRG